MHFLLFFSSGISAQSIWINELHYDNSGEDIDEFVEIVADSKYPDVRIYLYNGINGLMYDSASLDTLQWQYASPDYYAVVWHAADIQNGSPDGIALVAGDSVLEALSYEGEFTGMNGPALNVSFMDIKTGQNGTTMPGFSLQRTGFGSRYVHFSWSIFPATPAAINYKQVITSLPTIIKSDSLLTFSETPAFDHSAPMDFLVYAVNIKGSLDIYIPPGFEISLHPEFLDTYTFSDPLKLPVVTDWIPPTRIYVRFCPTEPNNYSDILLFDQPYTGITSELDLLGTEGLPERPRAWINEFHYDNEGTDSLEFVEIAIRYPEYYDLEQVKLFLYNGVNGAPYQIVSLDEAWLGERDTESNYQLYVFELTGIQNGPSDGIALAYNDFPLHFISYEGSFTAAEGPFAGRQSYQVLPEEDNFTPLQSSIQLAGEGNHPDDFNWVLVSGSNTIGRININQILPLQLLSFSFVHDQLTWTIAGEADIFGYQVVGRSSSRTDSLQFIPARNQPNLISEYNTQINSVEYTHIIVSQVGYTGTSQELFTINSRNDLVQNPCIVAEKNELYILLPESWIFTDVLLTLSATDGKMLKQLHDHPEQSKFSISHWLYPLSAGNYYLRVQNREEDVVLRFIQN